MFMFCLIMEAFSVFNTNDKRRMLNVKHVASKEIRSLLKAEFYP